jgi:hypothetical protein
MRLTLSLAITVAVLAACHRSSPPPAAPAPAPVRASAPVYKTGEDVLNAMHARYNGKWYSTLVFQQKTSRLVADKWNVQTWYEALHIPGKLRIDFDPISAGNGVLYTRDSAFTFQAGRAVAPQASLNPLLLLGFDVYAQPVSRTATLLRREGFDLTKVSHSTFGGRPMLVVGGRKQFWIDAEHLYFVRLLQPVGQDTSRTQDIRFVNYRREGGGWIAPRVEIHTDGKLVFYEDYSDIKTNVPIDPSFFDPAQWKSAKKPY